MGKPEYVEHKKRAFSTMGKGEVAWFAISREFSDSIYHTHGITEKHDVKNIGDLVYIKLSVDSIKRQPIYDSP